MHLAVAAASSSTSDSACRRNYLTADDLDPSEMFKNPLPIPNRLTANYTDPDDPAGTPVWVVHARAYTWRPADGVCIDKWGFEGTTPGPTLVAAPAERVASSLVYNELPDNLYNPYVDPFNQLAWQQAVAPNRTHYTSFGASPVEPPAPYDEAPYAQTQYELSPDLSIHLHGGHQTPENDGHPMDTFEPGHSHVYDYPNNQEATTLWYHDHAMDHTRGHVLNGLAGFYLVEDRSSRRRARPADRHRTACPCRRSPRRPTSSPPYWPTPGSRRPPTRSSRRRATTSRSCSNRCRRRCSPGKQFQPTGIGTPDDQPNPQYRAVWTVNGTLSPYLTVTNKPYRFRFLNGNDEEPMQIWTTTDADDPTSYSSDAYLQQVGTDGGLMNSVVVADPPSQTTHPACIPAQRADVVIDFSKITTNDDDLPAEQVAAGLRRRNGTVVPDQPVRVRRQRRPDAAAAHQVRRRPDHARRRASFDPPGGRAAHAERRPDHQDVDDDARRRRRCTERTLLFGFDGATSARTRSPPSTRQFFNPTADDGAARRRHHRDLAPDQQHRRLPPGAHPRHRVPGDVAIAMPDVERRKRTSRPTRPTRTVGARKIRRRGRRSTRSPATGRRAPTAQRACNLAWTDVFVIPPYSQVTVIGTFTDNVGTYVFHCHNLIHEDAGMMAQFEVVGDNSSPPTHSMVTHP